MKTNKTQTQTAETTANYIIIYESGCSNIISKEEVLRRVNEERTQYIQDGVDPEYIQEYFPKEITTLEVAKEWLKSMGYSIIEVPATLNSTQRILSRMFNNNGAIQGRIKLRKPTYGDQGYWNFTIKILDMDSELKSIIQLEGRKITPSGISDNGIMEVSRHEVSLYEFNQDIDVTVRKLINRFFVSNEGVGGSSYNIIRFAL